MTKLSVNINKVATLRNARGGNNPNVVRVAQDCQHFGAQGITVHPRPDERHIRGQDVLALAPVVYTEFNIEGNPDERYFELVKAVKPAQATLVPDAADVLTSNSGWDTVTHAAYLRQLIQDLKAAGAGRVSIFVDPVPEMIQGAAEVGADRIELYTGPYAEQFHTDPKAAVAPYTACALLAYQLGLGVNAGHDLDLHNLKFFKQEVPHLLEVSIGHALICDALYYGLANTIQMYLRQLS
ncbi:pyridoxine 5'-phosphate synthase [Eisenibacter elegans]|jgi:pyridoxine 5-phosphate synthase|uniref:pyridoxine 5'-phosphate synthase n=1 Tax=Eisenibacter elegans TaxID=997 RepID=UPI00047EE024|nr:pyridoxine 5'-phosphate synthase [Eisenibacter elegans]